MKKVKSIIEAKTAGDPYSSRSSSSDAKELSSCEAHNDFR
jgi:hypothetical protein